MSISNTDDFERNSVIEKNMYDLINTIGNFWEYSHENLKMAAFVVKT